MKYANERLIQFLKDERIWEGKLLVNKVFFYSDYLLPKEDLSYQDYPIDAYGSITKKRDAENMN